MENASRKTHILWFMILCASALVAKLAQIQIFDDQFQERARNTTLDKKTIYPSRGIVYDRNGELLVQNNPIYDLYVTYNHVDPQMDTTLFCSILGISKEEFAERLNKDWKKPQFHKAVPFVFLSKIDPSSYYLLQEHLFKFPGFNPVLRNTRLYPYHNAAHVLGYLSEVDRTTIEKSNGEYSLGDYSGTNGIEKTYETKLRGKKGYKFLLKDNLGREISSFNDGKLDTSAVSGTDIELGIDIDLQAYAEFLMEGKLGAIVAIEPKTGEILAMVSSPNYDPNILNLNRDRGKAIDSLLSDTIRKPFLDRSVISKYPPGSIFKPIFSLIALQRDLINPYKPFYCDGTYEVDSKGKYVQKCHNHPTPYNVSIAIQYSCNSYFYQAIRDFIDHYGYRTPGIGLDTLDAALSKFGLGVKLGSDVYYENPGFLPSSKFYDRLYSNVYNGWRSTYILSLGIGQGEIELTTLQMANLAAIIANHGYYYVPHLVKKFFDGSPLDSAFLEKHFVGVDEKHFDLVIDGMEDAIKSGTGRNAYLERYQVCGKTGTSQNPHGKDHSVFFGFAPRNNPKIALAVFVENAGWGAEVATPIAGLMIEKYLTDSISVYRKYKEDFIRNYKIEIPKS
ncbi:MAG TPA: penicillin-binding protein 2 [Saprospiraceae bacterium]|nr:penicillin-binding protein 2 [Saprospiraceae bacterium]